MRIRFHLTEDDVLAFARHISRRSPGGLSRVRPRLLLTALLTVLSVFVLVQSKDMSRALGFAGVCAALVVGMWVLPFLNRTWVLRVKLSREDLRFLGPREIEAREDGLHFRATSGESSLAWSFLLRIEVTDRYAFLFLTSKQAHVIPRERVVEGNLDAFLDVVRRYKEAQEAK